MLGKSRLRSVCKTNLEFTKTATARRSRNPISFSRWVRQNPEYTTMEWDYSIYEEIAIGIVDFCKADYREWMALKSRGREDGDWVVISEDESIVIY